MLLRKIHFKNFRNFKENTFEFNPLLTILLGENARGKTNILEGVHFLINGVGFRESKEEELIQFGSKNTCLVEGELTRGEEKSIFAITLTTQEETLIKRFLANKAKKRLQDYKKNQTKTVLFAPQHIEIITGSPHGRRDYFNKFISSFDLEYTSKLRNFEIALRKRNKILETYVSIEKLTEELKFWDAYLEEQADYLTKKREEYINYLNAHAQIDDKDYKIVYLKSVLTRENLFKRRELEMRVRRTLIGPQKDDFHIFIENSPAEGKNIHTFGSRSEQRLAVLWLKLNEISFLEEVFEKKPILLLDDVFSEFDLKHRALIMNLIKKYQTILTTTEVEVLDLVQVQKSVIKL